MYNELREYRFMCLGHSRNPGTLRGETSAGSPLPRAEQSKGDGCTRAGHISLQEELHKKGH